jgi:hypothetical protein
MELVEPLKSLPTPAYRVPMVIRIGSTCAGVGGRLMCGDVVALAKGTVAVVAAAVVAG